MAVFFSSPSSNTAIGVRIHAEFIMDFSEMMDASTGGCNKSVTKIVLKRLTGLAERFSL